MTFPMPCASPGHQGECKCNRAHNTKGLRRVLQRAAWQHGAVHVREAHQTISSRMLRGLLSAVWCTSNWNWLPQGWCCRPSGGLRLMLTSGCSRPCTACMALISRSARQADPCHLPTKPRRLTSAFSGTSTAWHRTLCSMQCRGGVHCRAVKGLQHWLGRGSALAPRQAADRPEH